MNIYICFFTKYEYFMYFLVSRFFTRFFAGSGPVHILGFAGSMTGPVPITLDKIEPKLWTEIGSKMKLLRTRLFLH